MFSRSNSFSTLDTSRTSNPAPWEVVRWTKLRRITAQAFSESGKRNHGQPTCLAVSANIIFGTTKGLTLVFNYSQTLVHVIGRDTKAIECGAVTALAVSADYTTIAVGHSDGNIFTWEIARPNRPFLHIPPVPLSEIETSGADAHVPGVSVIHLGFLGTRHTALASANDHGTAFSHLATRGTGSLGRTVKTKRIIGRYLEYTGAVDRLRKPSSVLAFSPLPLGNVEQSTDTMGLVAILTPYLLVIVSTTPVAHTQFKVGRPTENDNDTALTGCLAWFPAIKLKGRNSGTSRSKLVYCWSSVLTVLDVVELPPDPDDLDRPPFFSFEPRSRWRSNEPIVAVQWVSRSVLAVLTLSQQLLILEDKSLRVTDSFDLAYKHIYHADLFSRLLRSLTEFPEEELSVSSRKTVGDAFYMSFCSYKGRLFLMGVNDVSVGHLSNWSDRLLAYMENRDPISAIRLATSYYIGDREKLTVGLPEEDNARHQIVRERLLDIMATSTKFALGDTEETSNTPFEVGDLKELADACIAACDILGDRDFLFDEVYNVYEDQKAAAAFLDALDPYIAQGKIQSLPPSAIKSLVTHFSTKHTASRLEHTICLLDPTTMDIDQVTSLCKKHHLYDAYVCVWTQTLGDYVGPLIELFDATSYNPGKLSDPEIERASKIFPYMSHILTGRVYPTGFDLPDSTAAIAKSDIYKYLFSTSGPDGQSFPILRNILAFDTASFMSMLNEAFEDSLLNDGENDDHGAEAPVNRQYIISILLEVMQPGSPSASPDAIYLDMFIARNIPKYSQYILMPGSTLEDTLIRLCKYPTNDIQDDCQLSAEYLLSTFHPPDILALIPLLREAQFYRILKSVYKSEKRFTDLLLTYLEDPEDKSFIFTCIRDCLRSRSILTPKQREDVIALIQSNAAALADIDLVESAQVVQNFAPRSLHHTFIQALADDPYRQYSYLQTLLEPPAQRKAARLDDLLVEQYVKLMCQYNTGHVADYIDTLETGNLKLDDVLQAMETSGAIDAAVVLMARRGHTRRAMDRLVKYLGTTETALTGIMAREGTEKSRDEISETLSGLVTTTDKYVRVGIWLCAQQLRGKIIYQNSQESASPSARRKDRKALFMEPLTFEETLWLDMIECVVHIARTVTSSSGKSPTAEDQPIDVPSVVRSLVQQVFTALLTHATAPAGKSPSPEHNHRNDLTFLRILRAFLTRAASTSPSLSEIRSVLSSIFSAYAHEESLFYLANSMLEKDLFVHVDEVVQLRQHGWRPKGQVCEICHRRLWGHSAGVHIWRAWEDNHDSAGNWKKKPVDQRGRKSSPTKAGPIRYAWKGKGKGKEPAGLVPPWEDDFSPSPPRIRQEKQQPDLALVIFACRHIYHRGCLVSECQQRRERGDSSSDPAAIVLREGSELVCLLCNAHGHDDDNQPKP